MNKRMSDNQSNRQKGEIAPKGEKSKEKQREREREMQGKEKR